MKETESINQLNINHNSQIFEQVAAIMQMNGVAVDNQVQELLQPYIDGKESSEQTIARLEAILGGV